VQRHTPADDDAVPLNVWLTWGLTTPMISVLLVTAAAMDVNDIDEDQFEDVDDEW